jgi:diguanylate cyclase (GGDEF)-like protein/PAS domain S-box-containing protein
MQSTDLLFDVLLYGTVISALAVALALYALYRRERRLAYLIWCAAMVAAAGRYALPIALPGELGQLSPVLHYLNGLRGLLLAWGAAVFVGLRVSPWWALLLLVPAGWAGLGRGLDWAFVWVALLPALLASLGYLALGLCFWIRQPGFRWNGHNGMVLAAILEAVHILDYPFFRDTEFAPWGFALAQLFHYLMAGSLLVIWLRREQHRARTAFETQERALRRVLRSRRRVIEMREWVDTLMQQISDGIITCDREGRISGFNRGAERIFNYSAAEMLGRTLGELLPDFSAREQDLEEHTRAAPSGGLDPGERMACSREGRSFTVEVSLSELALADDQAWVAIVRDVSERKFQEERLNHLAEHDALTGLLNRRALERRLARYLPEAGEGWLVFLDLDDFKLINDSLGHEAGDAALQALAERLATRAGRESLVSRHSGDEFVVFRRCHPEFELEAWLESLVSALRQPIACNDMEVMLSGSLGVARYPEQGKDVASLVRNADLAMYQAKRTGKNQYAFFRADLLADLNRTADIATRLKKLDPDRELVAVFQPRMEIDHRRLMGAEVLLRWCTPEGEWIPPDRFIPVAEETGQILRIGYWVMEESCRFLAQWLNQGEPLVLSINLSARQLFDEQLVNRVESIRQRYHLSPAQLEFEITESSAMQDLDYAVRVLGRLRALGYGLSLDDFGTGFSSLSHLRRLPVDTVKIDRSFIQDMIHYKQARVLVASIVELVSNLDMQVLAEGVETREQVRMLDSLGCDQIQGYYVATPLTGEVFAEQVLADWSRVQAQLD